MLIHIVAPGESINKIATGYHCTISDIKANNLHITDFYHLAPGTKLKIPFISKDKIEVLEETEPFISDYYPTYNGYLNGKKSQDENEPLTPKEEVLNEEETQHPIILEEKIEEAKSAQKPNNVSKVYPINPYNLYFGNMAPKVNQKFIRKI